MCGLSDQRPTNRGARFSMKASGPSRASWLRMTSRLAASSSANASGSGLPLPWMAAHQVIEDRLAQRALSGTVAAQVLADSKGVQVIFDCGGNAAAAARVKDMMAPFALRWRIADHASAPQVGA